MKVTDLNFKERLNELCECNFKAKAIMEANGNDFFKIPKFQQEMFLTFMEKPKVSSVIPIKVEDNSKEEFEEFLEEKCDEFSTELRDDCDGSYVGAEKSGDIEYKSKKYHLKVIAFWEKANWCEYVLKENGNEIKSGSFY